MPGGIEDADAIALGEDESVRLRQRGAARAGRAGGARRGRRRRRPLEDIRVDVLRWVDGPQDWAGLRHGHDSAADGDWSVGGLAPGQYRFHFRDEAGGVYADQFFDHQRTCDAPIRCASRRGMNADWINADLQVGGFIGGVVQDESRRPDRRHQVTAFVNDPTTGGWPGVR